MFAAGEWALKRLLKYFLKRALRNIIKTRIDLEQLNVGLGEGRLELREVLLNTEYLNEHLVRSRPQFTYFRLHLTKYLFALSALLAAQATLPICRLLCLGK